MKITRFIEENDKIILTAVTDGEKNFFVGDTFKLTRDGKDYFFKVTSIESTDYERLICIMNETGEYKNRLSRTRKKNILDPRKFIGECINKVGDIEW